MSQSHAKDLDLFLGSYAVNAYYRGSDITSDLDLDENATVFGMEDYAYFPGLIDGKLELDGVYESAYASIVAAYKQTTGEPVTIAVAGATLDAPAIMLLDKMASLKHSAAVGGMVLFSLTGQQSGGVDLGRILHVGAETAADEETSTDWTASTANGGAAYLHVTAWSGTDVTIRVEHSANDSTWATLGTFTQTTGLSSQKLVIAEGTTVNRYLRAKWVTTGGFAATFTVGFARR